MKVSCQANQTAAITPRSAYGITKTRFSDFP